MMSKYSSGRQYDYALEVSPRGRRYVLENLDSSQVNKANNNTYNQATPRATVYNARHTYRDQSHDHSGGDNYHDIREAKSVTSKATEASQQTARSEKGQAANHVGAAPRVMPTENVTYRGRASKRTPRNHISNVSPGKPLYSETPSPTMGKSKKTSSSGKVSPKRDNTKGKGGKKGDKKKDDKAKNKDGLTPRDQYMLQLYDYEISHLRPSQVRYTHDEITAHFQDGRSLLATFKALLYGRVEIRCGPHDVPPIEVMFSDGMWFVVNGNRRLYVFKRLQKCGALKEMPVVARNYDALVMDKHFSTRTTGRTIFLVNDAHMQEKMEEQISRWQEWKEKKGKGGKGGEQTKRNNDRGNKGKDSTGDKKQTTDQQQSSSCCVIS